MSKRSHGEGSLSKRANGTYLAQVSIEGNRVSHTFKTRKEAQEWVTTTTGQVRQGLTYNSAKTTVDELITEWLNLKATKIRPATRESYNRMTRLYIRPVLGHLKMNDLTAARIQKFYCDLEKQGTGKRTIEHCHTVLFGFLKSSQKLGLVAQNWASLVDVPSPEKHEMKVWSESQVSQFLMNVNDPLYRLAFATGMRRGELIGSQWKDIDWSTGMLHVRRQVYRPEGGGFLFQEPKTDRGTRGIRLGRGLLESLRMHYITTIPQMIAISGDDWQEYDLIFPSSRGTPRDGYNVSKEFHELVIRSGLPVIRFHDIRHTAASIMLLHGEPPVRVAGILGQTVQVLMSTYSHYIPDDQERAANIMDAITTVHSFASTENSSLQQIATNNEKR